MWVSAKPVGAQSSEEVIGNPDALSWWILLSYGQEVEVSDILLYPGEKSLSNPQFFGSRNGETWFDIGLELENGSVFLNYLQLLFEEDGSGALPGIREIELEP